MSISLLKVDYELFDEDMLRIWNRYVPCQGIIGIGDEEAKNRSLKSKYRRKNTKRTFVWSKEQFKQKYENVRDAHDYFFVLCKSLEDMADIMMDGRIPRYYPIYVGPFPKRKDSIQVNEGCYITREEALSVQAIARLGYQVVFLDHPDGQSKEWQEVKHLFGY
ncbi:MAG: PTS sugar transporter subunit IIB [bacterium]